MFAAMTFDNDPFNQLVITDSLGIIFLHATVQHDYTNINEHKY